MVRGVSRWVLRRLAANGRVRQFLAGELTEQLRFAPPGHFYSPLPDATLVDTQRERLYGPPPADDGVALNAAGQERLGEQLAPLAATFDWPDAPTPGRRYHVNNGYFERGDGLALYAILRHLTPRRVVEVGSGFSSALMLDTDELHNAGRTRHTFIEPFPERLQGLLKPGDLGRARLLRRPVQEVDPAVFTELEAGDVLFIDSSHVSKLGSDVNHLMFNVLPRLRPGVAVHVHDVFYPFEYPAEWIRAGRAWNEIYLLRAFLQFNSAFELMWFNSFMAYARPDWVRERLPGLAANPGGSVWLRRL